MTQLVSARKWRKQHETDVDLGNGEHIRCRKDDLTAMFFEGRMPMPMLNAVQRMIDMPDASPIERIAAMGEDASKEFLEVLRQHVCRVAVDPVIVMQDDGVEDHLPVEYFTITMLMAVWNATALVPQVTSDEATTFREPEPRDDAVPPPDGGNVQDAPEPVDRRRHVELISQ